MPEVREIEARLVALRREVAEAKRLGSTPSQLRKLLLECCTLWAAVERFKYAHTLDLAEVSRH